MKARLLKAQAKKKKFLKRVEKLDKIMIQTVNYLQMIQSKKYQSIL